MKDTAAARTGGVEKGISATSKPAIIRYGAAAPGIMKGTMAGSAGGGWSLERGTSTRRPSIPTLIPIFLPT